MAPKRNLWQTLLAPNSSPSWIEVICVALLSVALAWTARFALTPVLGIRSPFMMFFIGVTLATWRSGWRSGVVTIPISAAIVVLLIDPLQSSGWEGFWPNAARIGMFVTVSAIIIVMMANLQSERNRLSQARATLSDINVVLERKVSERTSELVRTQTELQALTHSVAHDVRAPLRAIITNSVLLQREYSDKIDAEGLSMLERQRQNALRLSSLIDDMLEFARVSRTTLRIAAVDATELTKGIAADLQNRYGEKLVDFSIQERMEVVADPTMLGCIFENLLENACKFAPPGGITVKVQQKRQSDGSSFSVSDNGIGFDPLYASKIFEPFERLSSSPEIEGTGTGLASVKRMVELHGGKVEATSRGSGKGATFTLWLPAEQGALRDAS